jgi:hypothetical protein
MSRRVDEMLDQIGQYVLAYPGVEVSPFDDGERGEIGYRSVSTENPAKWVFRFRDLQNFYKGLDPRAEQVRTYLMTPTGRQYLPSLLAELLRPTEDLYFIGPTKLRFHIIEDMCS